MIYYTDGGCSPNPGPGGWGWATSKTHFDSGYHHETTNQRMELWAALEAVRNFTLLEGMMKEPLEIVSDSSYLVNCFKDKWHVGWMKRGWKNSKKEPVANRDIWEPLIHTALAVDAKFTWVKGHSGHVMNDFVDRLAVNAYKLR